MADEDTTYTCQGDRCVITERASEMFNLACDPKTTTIEKLRLRVLCRDCAVKVAAATGYPMCEKGSGIYPLGVTLRQMSRREDDPIPPGAVTYPCAEPNCAIERQPRDMYNLATGVALEGPEAILPYIRCGEHARAIAEARGKRPCEPGSDIYPLQRTLGWIEESSQNKGKADF